MRPRLLPWRYDENFQQIFRGICEDRMRFIPYLYSLAHTSAETGTLMQPRLVCELAA